MGPMVGVGVKRVFRERMGWEVIDFFPPRVDKFFFWMLENAGNYFGAKFQLNFRRKAF